MGGEGPFVISTSSQREVVARLNLKSLVYIWGGPVGGFIVLGLGYIIVGKHRRLILDEILAGVALLIWIIVDRVSDSMFGGADPDVVKIWIVRGVLILVMTIAYGWARKQWHVEEQKV